MTIARVTTWSDGQVLTAAALNAEFDNIINAANNLTLISPLSANLDFNTYQAVDLVLENNPGGTNTRVAGRVSFFPSQAFLLLETSSTGSGPLLILPPYGNSRVTGLRGSLSSNSATFEADHGYMLERSVVSTAQQSRNPVVQCNATSAFTIDTQTTMSATVFGGRDQTAAFASTYIHYYAVTTGVHSTAVYGVCSCVAPPVGPSMSGAVGYWAYLCSAMYTPASSVITRDITVNGSRVYYNTAPTLISAGTAASLTSAATPLATYVPPTATQVMLNADYTVVGSTDGGLCQATFAIATASSGVPRKVGRMSWDTGTTASTQQQRGTYGDYTLPVVGSVPVLYYFNTATPSDSTGTLDIGVEGFIVPNGDV